MLKGGVKDGKGEAAVGVVAAAGEEAAIAVPGERDELKGAGVIPRLDENR